MNCFRSNIITSRQDTIRVPSNEFAAAVWMTHLLRSPTSKGNFKRDGKGNRVVDLEHKKSIHNEKAAYFTALSAGQKEERCMQVVKHLRKYFEITDCKTEWTVSHGKFATAKSLNEEVLENILPYRSSTPKKGAKTVGASPPTTPRASPKRKFKNDEESSKPEKSRKRRKLSSDSDVSSSFSASESSSLVSSPGSYCNQPESPADLASVVTSDTYGVFQVYPTQVPLDSYCYPTYNHYDEYYYPPADEQPWEEDRPIACYLACTRF